MQKLPQYSCLEFPILVYRPSVPQWSVWEEFCCVLHGLRERANRSSYPCHRRISQVKKWSEAPNPSKSTKYVLQIAFIVLLLFFVSRTTKFQPLVTVTLSSGWPFFREMMEWIPRDMIYEGKVHSHQKTSIAHESDFWLIRDSKRAIYNFTLSLQNQSVCL